MSHVKRILALLLALLMTVSLLMTAVSCGEVTEEPVDTGSKGTTPDSDTEAETKAPYDLLDKENYDRTFTVLVRNDCTEDFVVDAMTGDLLADSIYERNTVVGEDYGVEFSFVYNGYDYIAVNEAVKKQVSGGIILCLNLVQGCLHTIIKTLYGNWSRWRRFLLCGS